MSSERLNQVREFLAQYATLQPPACDEIGWLMLKLSCTRQEAARLVGRARAQEERRAHLAEIAHSSRIPTRHTEAMRTRSLDGLRARIFTAPLAVRYDTRVNAFVVSRSDSGSEIPLCSGRYQVVAAYIDGFARACINRPSEAL